jgi:hypothetical protein
VPVVQVVEVQLVLVVVVVSVMVVVVMAGTVTDTPHCWSHRGPSAPHSPSSGGVFRSGSLGAHCTV